MKKMLTVALLLLAGAANAAPATYKKSGPDRYGVTTFWVKCENGNVSTTQCLRDVAHCGSGNDSLLLAAAVLACDSIVGLMLERGR